LSMFLISRALAAIGAGVVTPVAASVAIALVSEQERGRALAFVFGGLTLSQAIGMPIGAWLGYSVGWRETFALAGLLAFPAAIVLFRQLPTGLVVPVTNLRSLVDACTRPKLLAAIAFTVFFMGGVWTLYTFFAPVLTVSFGLDGTGVSALLLVFGIGAVLGNVLGGRLTDSLGPDRTLACLCLGQAISMPLFTVGIFSGTAAGATEIIAAGALTLGWSIVGWSFMVPQQARLAALDPALAPVLLALNAAAIYLAAALGSANGGYVLDALGMVALGPVSVVLIIAALVSIPVTRRLRAAPAADGLDPADVERTES
ncbi:MAG: MFS transporter, partial [Pseudomonadota bacterium]